jgi:hypothetical protein
MKKKTLILSDGKAMIKMMQILLEHFMLTS